MHSPVNRKPLMVAGLLALAAIGLFFLLQGSLQGASYQLLAWQRELHRSLTLAITELARTPTQATWWVLLSVSFGYGVFHAAGPGHGKAVLATYLASHGGATRRALGLSFAASLLQGVTAIVMVAVLVHGLGWLTRQAMGSVVWVEQASFLLVTLLGGWLCLRAYKQLRRAYRPLVFTPAVHSHTAGPVQGHAHLPGHDHHCCGGAHHVEPQQALDWRTAIMTVLAIGMRPCSGAVLLLGAASLLGQFYVGVVSVVAMSLGTGITVSALALASVFARRWATRRLAKQQHASEAIQKVAGWAALAGGALIIVLGVTLAMASATQPAGTPFLGEPPTRQGSPLLR
ncbi:nickel/cobalt transporter [Halomonas aquamarina]|uniref:Nickel/cobalt transporter n=1 Tax=Vreelandella aquamarina TaxID=77097 RepID=A0ACC5VP28_9GAMM|nr:nickel/cobalt transporter [Halomonas aquamarina]MBZ5485948.1 nickel/cobalt transporter [Halomonas aquamarina]